MNALPLAVQEDKVLVACDFAQIEARVIAWLAGQRNILDVFASGEDIYMYDARSVGSDNRQLGKPLRLGLGFGMWWPKFIATAATYGVIIDEAFAEEKVKAWREANDKIVRFWWNLDGAFRGAIKSPAGSKFKVGDYITISRGKTAVFIRLPSGRQLVYRNARLVTSPEARHCSGTEIVYDGVDQKTHKWGPIRTYGGKLAENVTQAVARDIMAYVLLRLDAAGVDLRLTIHDEIIAVCAATRGEATKELMLRVMRAGAPWAPGLPVGAEGWVGPRYRK